MSTKPARPPRPVTPLQRAVVGVLGALLLAGICAFHFARNFTPGVLSPDGMDTVQSARRVANGKGLSTNVVRPLLLRRLRANGDGSLPDTAHQPLYPSLAGIGMKFVGGDGPGRGDKVAVLLSFAFFLTSVGATFLLARRLFGNEGALLSAALFALGADALSLALDPRPITLATTLFTLLLFALVGLDVDQSGRRAGVAKSAGAGALFGLLFLTIYSSLILLPPLLIYVYQVTRRDRRALGAFAAGAFLVAAPLLLRNLQVAGNPFFNARLVELVMHTPTYPGYSLYGSVGMSLSMLEYFAGGGIREVIRKMGGNLLGYYTEIPFRLGVLLLPLFLVASLTRFTSPSVNRLRVLVYVLIGLHLLGLSFFLPYREGLPLLLMYLPFVAAVATTFFLNLIRARNLPAFNARAGVAAWTFLACLPGVVLLSSGAEPRSARREYDVFKVLNDLPQIRDLRAKRNGVLASDVPWEIAYRVGVPALWLPIDSTEFRVTQERLGQPVQMIVLTPALGQGEVAQSDLPAWRATYDRFASFLVTVAYLDPPTQQGLFRKVRLYYPQEISAMMSAYRPQPVVERGIGGYSLLFRDVASAATSARGGGR